MDITKKRLREIIKEEIDHFNSLREARVPGQAARGPWDNDYEDWAELADQTVQAYTEGSPQEFIEMFETMSPEDHAGVYLLLRNRGGMDPMKGVKPGDEGYVDWRDRPLRDRNLMGLSVVIRRMMDNETHEVRRVMSEPPAPSHTKKGQQYDSYGHYFRSEIAPDYSGGDESPILAKYMRDAPSTNPVMEDSNVELSEKSTKQK